MTSPPLPRTETRGAPWGTQDEEQADAPRESLYFPAQNGMISEIARYGQTRAKRRLIPVPRSPRNAACLKKQEEAMQYIKHKSEESLEDYLETILLLQRRIGNVRSIDIAGELGYSKPSVSVAMKNLRTREYVTVDENGFITLTESGKERAEGVLERHTLLSDWLIRLGVDEQVAREDACRMEHDISAESFAAIKECISKMDPAP